MAIVIVQYTTKLSNLVLDDYFERCFITGNKQA